MGRQYQAGGMCDTEESAWKRRRRRPDIIQWQHHEEDGHEHENNHAALAGLRYMETIGVRC